jgi:hypothetical protein
MPTANLLLLDSTNVIELSRLRDAVTKQYLDETSTAEVSLYDANGAPVADAQGIPMTYTPGQRASEGKFHGAIDASIALVDGATYDARVHVTSAIDGSERTFHLSCIAAKG